MVLVVGGHVDANRQLVYPSAHHRPDKRPDDGYPEPTVILIAEHFTAIAGNQCKEPRSEVSRRIARITGVVGEASADHHKNGADN